MNLKEIERLAFLKYRLSGARAMNTFIFTQAKNNNLSDKQIDNLLLRLHNKIEKEKQTQKKEESLKIKKVVGSTLIFE